MYKVFEMTNENMQEVSNFFTNFQFIQLSTEDMKLTTHPGRSQGCWNHAYASTLHLGSAAPYILNAWIETWNMKKNTKENNTDIYFVKYMLQAVSGRVAFKSATLISSFSVYQSIVHSWCPFWYTFERHVWFLGISAQRSQRCWLRKSHFVSRVVGYETAVHRCSPRA